MHTPSLRNGVRSYGVGGFKVNPALYEEQNVGVGRVDGIYREGVQVSQAEDFCVK